MLDMRGTGTPSIVRCLAIGAAFRCNAPSRRRCTDLRLWCACISRTCTALAGGGLDFEANTWRRVRCALAPWFATRPAAEDDPLIRPGQRGQGKTVAWVLNNPLAEHLSGPIKSALSVLIGDATGTASPGQSCARMRSRE